MKESTRGGLPVTTGTLFAVACVAVACVAVIVAARTTAGRGSPTLMLAALSGLLALLAAYDRRFR